MQLPLRARLGEILALMRAAAFAAIERGLRDRLRNGDHVAQIEPFQPLQVERRAMSGRLFAQLLPERGNAGQRPAQFCAGAKRPDVVSHDGLQARDHRGGIRNLATVPGRPDKIDGGTRVLRSQSRRRRAAASRGGAFAGAAAEHQSFGDGVAGQPVGAVGAADHFAGDIEAGQFGTHVGSALTPPM